MKYSIFIKLIVTSLLMPVCSYSQVMPATTSLDRERDPQSRLTKMNADDERVRREMAMGGASSSPKLSKQDLERMKEMRKVDAADMEKYKDFVRSDKTGIFRLFPNMDCITPKLVRIDGECAQFVPGSSYFSFRTKQYSDALNQDMGFVVDEMISGGFFSQGIFVPLGNVPIENVTLDQPGVKYLADMQAETDFAAAKVKAPQFRKGLEVAGFIYGSHAKAVVDNTYAFRLIAYKVGNTMAQPKPDASRMEVLLWDLNFDKRADEIIALRVVRLEPGGNATILWKELSRKDAPKLKFAKGEAYTDFK